METSIGRTIKLSNEYIRGLVEGEGCFTFCRNSYFSKKLNQKKYDRAPAFIIAMHVRDKDLIRAICCQLRLTNAVYEYQPLNKDGWNRGRMVRLIVREYFQLRDIIVPFFYKKLKGHKGVQFDAWLEKIGNDLEVSKKFRTIYQLHKTGYYDSCPYPRFWEEREKETAIKNESQQDNQPDKKGYCQWLFSKT